MKKGENAVLVMMVVAISLFIFFSSASAQTSISKSFGQTVYVPVYSHIYSGDNERPFYLAATLSIRNTDPNRSIVVLAVDYHDSEGKLLKKYLEVPAALKPLASIRYLVKESDKAGGSGANFVVKWKSDAETNAETNPPIIESVMIGTQTQQGISFTSRGQVVEERTP